METTLGFTPQEMKEASQYDSLGPQYFGGRNAAEALMAKFEDEHFKPLIDKFADDFRDKLWTHVQDSLLSDTKSNVGLEIGRMVEGTIRALLTGEEWAMRMYPFCDYRDGAKIRAKLAEHAGDEIAKARIADLEKELASVRSDLEWHCRR